MRQASNPFCHKITLLSTQGCQKPLFTEYSLNHMGALIAFLPEFLGVDKLSVLQYMVANA